MEQSKLFLKHVTKINRKYALEKGDRHQDMRCRNPHRLGQLGEPHRLGEMQSHGEPMEGCFNGGESIRASRPVWLQGKNLLPDLTEKAEGGTQVSSKSR